jgi:hypothetical protein
LTEPVDAVLAVELLDVADEVVVEEITSRLAFVTVVVEAVAPEVPEVPELADFAAVAEPVAPGVVVGEPRAAMALLRLALMFMISSPNRQGLQPFVGCSERTLACRLDFTTIGYKNVLR